MQRRRQCDLATGRVTDDEYEPRSVSGDPVSEEVRDPGYDRMDGTTRCEGIERHREARSDSGNEFKNEIPFLLSDLVDLRSAVNVDPIAPRAACLRAQMVDQSTRGMVDPSADLPVAYPMRPNDIRRIMASATFLRTASELAKTRFASPSLMRSAVRWLIKLSNDVF